MFFRILRGAILLASTAIVVPYAFSLFGNIIYGWPQCRNKYKRAFSPQKVFSFNYTFCQMIKDRAKLLFLYLTWRKFYANADPQFVLKDIPYGRNECHLDLYLPKQKPTKSKRPVVIFIYGGTWSSGNKNMYGLLCSELVSTANVLAVCPNYSYYPKGYVDDMIQDVVDCVTWAIESIDQYGGDPNKIILMGHSAGGHLCAMSILEMLHDECTSIQQSFKFQPVDKHLDELNFAESYYGSQGSFAKHLEGLEDSSGSSESFSVVSEHGSLGDNGASLKLDSSQASASLLSSTNSEGFTTLSNLTESQVEKASNEAAVTTEEPLLSSDLGTGDHAEKEYKDQKSHERFSSPHSGSVGDDEEQDDSGDNDSIVTVRPKDIEGHLSLTEVSKSVVAFIGLAGVYSISDQFQHEFYRGVEDVSNMARAHYGVDHFDRFSPTQIVKRFGQFLSLPLVVLVHGTTDFQVPVSSSSKFAEALSEISANVNVRVIPGLPHYDIVMDLMDKNRAFYNHIMSVVMETVKTVS